MNRAFSLVEIAIVLVILGLLTGGVLTGQALIRASELRSLTTVVREFQSAKDIFKDKYFAVPGELLTYQSFWPQLVGSYCPKTTWNPGNLNGVMDNSYENEAAFAQLQAAGLIQMGRPQILQDGTVRGYYDCMENWMQQRAGFKTKFSDLFGLIVAANGVNGVQYGAGTTAAANVDEAFSIDQKYDDGRPNTGIIRGFDAGSSGGYCVSNTTPTGVYYQPSMNLRACGMTIYFGV